MHVFVLMTVKASGQSYVQDFVAKSAANPPSGTVGHHRKRPLRCPGPVNKLRGQGSNSPEWHSNLTISSW